MRLLPPSLTRKPELALVLGGVAVGLILGPAAWAATDSFASLMATAMDRMDRDMMVRPSGDPDRDFATMMIPHHRGAIDMAKVELRYGRDQVLLRLAQGIVVEQQQEIAVMRQAIASLPAASMPSRADETPAMTTMTGMTPPTGSN